MICAPATGCVDASCCRSTSAGGQLSHPSDVNSSTTTGVGPGRAPSTGSGRGARGPAAATASSAITQNTATMRRIIAVMLSELLFEADFVADRDAGKSRNLPAGMRDDVVGHQLDQSVSSPLIEIQRRQIVVRRRDDDARELQAPRD